MKSLSAALAMAVGLMIGAAPADAALLALRFDQPSASVQVGGQVSVNLMADIDVPVIGFDLDVTFDAALASLTGVTFGPQWEFGGQVGNQLFGLAPYDVGTATQLTVSGNDVLLATLTFTGVAPGLTALGVTFTGFDQGFFLQPDPESTDPFPRVLADSVTNGSLQVVPEPATLALLLSAALGAGRVRPRRR